MNTIQIEAINNIMTLLTDIKDIADSITFVEDYNILIDNKINSLKEAGVDEDIIVHVTNLLNSYTSVAIHASKRHEEYLEECTEFYI